MAMPVKINVELHASNVNRKRENLQFVVAVDDSSCARNAFKWADFIAQEHDKLIIIHSAETESSTKRVHEVYSKYVKQDHKRYALQILKDADSNVDQRILRFVNNSHKQSVELLVTGLYGRTFEKLGKHPNKKSVAGSTSDLSLRSARCSSFFVRRDVIVPEDQSKLVLMVAVDGSENSLHAFECATRLMSANNTLYVVHIKTEYAESVQAQIPEIYRSENVIKNYQRLVEETQNALGFKVKMEVKLLEKALKIPDALCKFAAENKCHVLFVGADGMTAHCNKQPILGSVSDECVTDSPCNVIVTQLNEMNSTPRGSFSQASISLI
eukprot:CAMPEP_0197021474 /NCGR_PEP_ID=MMETSP1384-20130603/2359_1 /TAXON_ID=29189 /ORGANISM="Ammonia sp." /LENGTH=325 /DNA_ID=CAMNT_0042449307 /DNA_START=156 /DNA_END=1133 /DNA_ORIENTATION=+